MFYKVTLKKIRNRILKLERQISEAWTSHKTTSEEIEQNQVHLRNLEGQMGCGIEHKPVPNAYLSTYTTGKQYFVTCAVCDKKIEVYDNINDFKIRSAELLELNAGDLRASTRPANGA